MKKLLIHFGLLLTLSTFGQYTPADSIYDDNGHIRDLEFGDSAILFQYKVNAAFHRLDTNKVRIVTLENNVDTLISDSTQYAIDSANRYTDVQIAGIDDYISRTWDDTLRFEYQNESFDDYVNVTSDISLVLKRLESNNNPSTSIFEIKGDGIHNFTFDDRIELAAADTFDNTDELLSRYICLHTPVSGAKCRLDWQQTYYDFGFENGYIEAVNLDTMYIIMTEYTQITDTSEWSIDGDVDVGLSDVSVRNDTLTFTLSGNVNIDSTITVSYDSVNGNTYNEVNRPSIVFSNESVSFEYDYETPIDLNPFYWDTTNWTADGATDSLDSEQVMDDSLAGNFDIYFAYAEDDGVTGALDVLMGVYRDEGTPDERIYFIRRNDGKLQFTLASSTNGSPAANGSRTEQIFIDDQNPKMVINIRNDGNNLKVYVDGEEVIIEAGSSDMTGWDGIENNPYTFLFGCYNRNGEATTHSSGDWYSIFFYSTNLSTENQTFVTNWMMEND